MFFSLTYNVNKIRFKINTFNLTYINIYYFIKININFKQGTVLWGQKTLLDKASSFDRVSEN